MRFPGFIGPSYTMQSVNIDCQRCVNLFPEINALGTGKEKEVASLVPTPGLRLLLTLTEGPIRGIFCASNGELYAVAGAKLYQISSSWVATLLGSLNTDTGPVSFADNGTTVFLVDGLNGFTYNMTTDTFAQVSDPDFFTADQVTYIDGYFVFNKSGTSQFFISGLNDVTFDPLDFASAEGSPDALIALMASNQSVFLFGPKSIEVFYNSGDADFPFARMQGAVVDVGCAAPFSISKIAGSIYFLGGDANGSGIVYRMNGYQPQRISTPAIESVIRSLTSEEVEAVTAFTYQQGGHIFYCINLPGTLSTWVYDASTEFWHERTFLNLWSEERHRAEFHAVAFGVSVVGDYENGKIYQLDQDTLTDNGTPISRVRTAPHISENLNLIRHNKFQLDMETGVGINALTQGNDPQVMLSWSDDGGHSWSNEHWSDAGKIGKRLTRVIWRRLGMSRDRVYQIKITDPVKVVLIGAQIDVEGGAS